MTRRKNKGWFKKGPDARRHELTFEERSRGGQTTFRMGFEGHSTWLLGYLQQKINRTAKPGTLAAYKVRARYGITA